MTHGKTQKGRFRLVRIGRTANAALESLEHRMCLAAAYAPAPTIGTTDSPEFIASADFNGDLKRDLVVSSYNGTRLIILLGTADGTFTESAPVPLAGRPDFVTTGDLNADGNVDLITANFESSTVSVLLGAGNGTFGSPVSYASGAGTRMVVLGDFTGDNITDIAVGKSTGTSLTLLPGTGTGTLAAAVNTTLAIRPIDLTAGDFNQDGKLDLAAASFVADRAVVLLGNGNGTFTTGQAYVTGGGPAAITTADFDGDGKLDLATANYTGNSLSLFLGNGNGTFGTATTLAAGTGATHLVAADLDGNSTTDLVVANATSNTVGVFINTAGTFASMSTYATGSSPRSVVAANFNGGKVDIAVANELGASITVLLETGVTIPPVAIIGGPYSVVEGGSVALSSTASTGEGLTHLWDLDADGVFGETGASALRGNETGSAPTLIATGLDGTSSHTVWLRVVDDGGQSSTTSTAVSVVNVAPTLTISGSATVNEGTTYTLNLSKSDPGTDTLTQWVINWGDGTTSTLPGTATTATKVYADNATRTITATATDEDGTYTTNSLTVAVANVAPTLTISGTSTVNEGATYTLNLGKTDPGTDTLTQWVINWGDGTSSTLPGTATSATKVYTDNATRTITATATDEDGTYSTNSRTVTVNNVAPTLTLSGAGTVYEGSTYSLTLTAIDPGSDTLTQWVINWGDGTTTTVPGSTTTVTKVWADNASRTVVASATDEDGSYTSSVMTVLVANVAPTLTIDGQPAIVIGNLYTLSLDRTDPGTDTLTQWVIDWGNGSTTTLPGSATTAQHLYGGIGQYTIRATATDEDGQWTANTRPLTVATDLPDPPTATAGSGYTVAEGGTVQLSAAGSTGTGISYLWDLDGDGIFGETGNAAARGQESGMTTTLLATGLDGPGVHNVQVKVVDTVGQFAIATAAVTVTNTTPTLAIAGAASTTEGATYVLSLTRNDPGADTLTQWAINWGDGTTSTLPGTATTATKVYADNATRTITATATDEDGTYTTNSLAVTVANVAPTLTISGNSTVNEGATYTLNLGKTDPGTDTLTQWVINWGDGTSSTLPGTATSATKVYADNATRTITATATDEDGTYSTDSRTVTVNNVAPLVSLLVGSSTPAGGTFSMSLASIDPGQDTITRWLIDWGDGTTMNYAGTVRSMSRVYETAGAYRVQVSAIDDDGTWVVASQQVTIVAAPPLLIVTGPGEVSEATVYELSLAYSQPTGRPALSWLIDWGDGATTPLAGTATSATYIWTSQGTYHIVATAVNADGIWAADAVVVQVGNTPPVLTTAVTSADGKSASLSFSYNDDGRTTPSAWRVDWGDGTIETLSADATSASRQYAEYGQYSVLVVAIDEDGEWSLPQRTIDLPEPAGQSAMRTTSATVARGNNWRFQVTYTSDARIDPLTVDANDLVAVGPDGTRLPVAVASKPRLNKDGSVLATYRVNSPGRNWTYNDNGQYTLELAEGAVATQDGRGLDAAALGTFSVRVIPRDAAGTVSSRARSVSVPAIGKTRLYRDVVADFDTEDAYRLKLSRPAAITFELSQLRDDADLELVDAAGAVVASSAQSGTAAEALSLNLDRGTYFARVKFSGTKVTEYQLAMTAAAPALPPATEDPSSASIPTLRLAGSAPLSSATDWLFRSPDKRAA
jgi:PKD repeat protein